MNHLFAYKQTSKIKDTQTKQRQLSQQLQQSELQEPLQKYSVNIMIVDDEADTLFTYEWFLSDEGYNLEGFTDPQEALKRFVQLEASYYYQLVLLDIRMPRLNGLQLFNTMKAINP